MKISKVISIALIVMILLISLTTIVNATVNPSDFDPSTNNPIQKKDTDEVNKVAGPILGTLKVIGIVLSVVGLAVIGLKFMIGSASEKAEYKKTLIPYIIGVFMIISITVFLGIIEQVVKSIEV